MLLVADFLQNLGKHAENFQLKKLCLDCAFDGLETKMILCIQASSRKIFLLDWTKLGSEKII